MPLVPDKNEPGVDVVCGWRGQEVEARWGSGNRERVARWKSNLAEASGGAQESGRVLATSGQVGSHGRNWSQANVPTGSGSGRSRPTEEVWLAVPSPGKGTRENALVHLQKK